MGNMQGAPPSTPNTPLEACLCNRLNIEPCQVMVEIQSTHQDPLRVAYPDEENPIDKLRQAANTWISLKCFMPTHFQTDPADLHKLEVNTKLNPQTITCATWIKDPKRHNPNQKHTNIKIYCKSPKVANTLIMGSPLHLGSQLRIHKDIKAPSTCLNCQQYSHYATNCKETSPTCGKCASTHTTAECKADETKCTPCGSDSHQTNNLSCPKRQN